MEPDPAPTGQRAAPETPGADPPPLEWPSWRGWPYLLLGLAILAVALSAWRPMPAGLWHDDGVYVLIGKSLAEGHGLSYHGVVGSPPAPKFPPLYPGVLAVLWGLFGGVGAVTLVAELLNLVLIAVAGALLGWTLHRHAGMPQKLALGTGLLAFVSADLLRPALIPLSEPLFMALLMGVLATWPRERGSDIRRAWLPVALLVLLVLTRTAGVAAVAGVGLASLLRLGVRRSLMLLAPALVTLLAWGTWAGRRAAEIPEALRDVLGPYMGWLTGQILSDPVAFAARLPQHGSEVASRVAVFLLPGTDGAVLWVAFLPLLALAAVGARRLHGRHPALVWTAAAYVGLLLVWPYVDRRLVAPLHPFMVALIVAGALTVLQRLEGRPSARVFLALAFLWMGAYGVQTASRIASGWPVAAYRIRADALATGLEALEQAAPQGAVVGAPELWAALSLHGGWTVVPSALFAPAATVDERPVWGTPEEQLALWRTTGVELLLLEQGGQIHGDALNVQEEACPGSVRILARMPPQMLVRLHWEVCASGG